MKNFRERTFVFGWCCWFCVFRWVFAYVFALFLAVRSRKCLENSLDVRSGVFWVRSLFLWFFRRRRFSRVLFERYRSGSNRTPPHAPFCLFLFSFYVPPRLLFRPFWPCVPLLGVFLGVPFWAPRVFGILLELTGLELARPFRGPFLGTRGGKGFPVLLLPCFFFPLLFCFAATLFLEGPPRDLAEAGRG